MPVILRACFNSFGSALNTTFLTGCIAASLICHSSQESICLLDKSHREKVQEIKWRETYDKQRGASYTNGCNSHSVVYPWKELGRKDVRGNNWSLLETGLG